MTVEKSKIEIDRNWTELIWAMSDGDMNNFTAFKSSNMIDFFTILKSNEKKYGRV